MSGKATRERVHPKIRSFFSGILQDWNLCLKDRKLPSPFPAVLFGADKCGASKAAALFAELLEDCSVIQSEFQRAMIFGLPEIVRHLDDARLKVEATHVRGKMLAERFWERVSASCCIVLDDLDSEIRLRPDREALWVPIAKAAKESPALRGVAVSEELPTVEEARQMFLSRFAEVRSRKPCVVVMRGSPLSCNEQNFFTPASAEWILQNSWLDVSGLPLWSEVFSGGK